MEKSKRSKGVDLDRISTLPDPILDMILSRLEYTEEAVRTSVLSTRWRYLWTCLQSIDIDCYRGGGGLVVNKSKFNEFVYSVISNRVFGLHRFRLCCLNYYDMSTIDGWIHAAILQKPKQIHLSFSPSPPGKDEDIELPHCLVTSDSLEVLSLSLYRRRLSFISLLNYSTPFPGLRVLELKDVELPHKFYTQEFDFLERCPLLEELRLIDCVVNKMIHLIISSSNLKTLTIDTRKMMDYQELHDDGTFSINKYQNEGFVDSLLISCPKLVFFEYAGETSNGYSFHNLDSLKKVVLHPEPMLEALYLSNLVTQLFLEVSHLESLSINHYFIQCAFRDDRTVYPASLPNLKTLELTTTIDDFTMNVLIRILKCSPNIESLHLTIQEEFSMSQGYWELDGAETRGILTRHLKRVEFLEFNGEKQKLDIASFLLEHGNALEEMVFSWRNKVKYHEKSMETMKEVSKFNKASAFVKLITLLKD